VPKKIKSSANKWLLTEDIRMKNKMKTRRQFIKTTTLLFGSMTLGCRPSAKNHYSIIHSLSMPEEGEEHERTWMSFVANDYIWLKKQIPEVKRNLALIAITIAKYEPVSVLISRQDYDEGTSMFGNLTENQFPIEFVEFSTDDLWLRDTAPIFVVGEDRNKYAIDFNFNGWGEKQEHSQDSKVARFIVQKSKSILQKTNLVLEGGCFEVDGYGTAIITKSCVINNNRNPQLNQEQIEKELKLLLGLRKIIWLEGIKGKDITDGHTDFYARFTKQGEVIVSRDNYKGSYDYDVTRDNINILQNSTDADGNRLNVIIIDTPNIISEEYGVNDFAAGYIGYYLCNNAVIMQSFGDEEMDNIARRTLEGVFPNRVVEQIAINGIASGGGTIHCTTQQEIKI
jgi:agmatine deiminase